MAAAKAMSSKKFLSAIAVILIAIAFVGLGNWQLGRARDLRAEQAKTKIIDPTIYPLDRLANPATALDSRNVGKQVTVSGHYIANFKAPQQIDAQGVIADWEVALLEVDETQPLAGILVVRGLWSERLMNPEIAMSTGVTLTGVMQPHQFDDHAENTPGVISRLDSSVIVGLIDTVLYDGYIAATSEIVRAGPLERVRVTPPAPISRVGGFYWQHISYVAIWWLLAGLVLYLPFYKRRVAL